MATVRKREWLSTPKAELGQEPAPAKKKSAWVVTYTDQDGKRRQGGTFERKKDADREKLRIEQEIESGTHTARQASMSLQRASELFIESCEQRRILGDKMSGYHLRSLRSNLDNMICPKFGHRLLTEITTHEVEEWLRGLAVTRKASTIKRYERVLSAVLQFSVRKRWIKRNLLRDDPVRLPAAKKRQVNVAAISDVKAILAVLDQRDRKEHLRTHHYRPGVILLGLFGGLRSGEIRGLQWEDVDFENGNLLIKNSYSDVDGLKSTKTEAGERVVPMAAAVKEALLDVLRFQQAYQAAIASEPPSRPAQTYRLKAELAKLTEPDLEAERTGPVFVLADGGYIKQADLRNHYFVRVQKRAGILADGKKPFSMHSLRHTCVSLLIKANMPILNVSKMVGHARTSVTLDVYSHLFPEDTAARTVVDAIDMSFRAATPAQQIEATN